MYNKGTNVLYASTNVPFSFSFSRINLFNTLVEMDSTISLTNIPTFAWYKPSEVAMNSGTFNATTTTIASHNFTTEELATLPALTNFIFPNKKIFSLGTFVFNVNALTDKDTKMVGLTKPKASILIQYNEVSEVITADENGQFSYTYEEALPIGTKITFQSKLADEVIYHTKVITIVYSGELVIDKTTELKVMVTDSRINSSAWKLYATINHDLTNQEGKILRDSLVFKDSTNDIIVLSNQPTLIYMGESNGGQIKVTEVV